MIALALAYLGCARELRTAPAAETPAAAPAARAPLNRAAVVQPSSDRIPVGPDDAVWGSPNAPVTLVMFADFECPFCARANQTLHELRQRYGPDQLRIVYKHNPLPFHPGALPAARAAQAVLELAGDEAFFAYADLLYENQRSLHDTRLSELAQEIGLSRDAFAARFQAPELAARIEDDLALARSLGEQGTPAFRINGARLLGAQPYASFAELIDAELGHARALLAAGTPVGRVYAARVAENLAAAPPQALAEAGAEEAGDVYRVVPIGGSPVRGPADALVTIVEFSEYQCPFCKHAEPTIEQLLARYPRELRVVFKHNPLPFHEHARAAALLAIEARKQRGDAAFWRTSARLFEHSPELDEQRLLRIAAELKLDVARARAALHDHRHDAEIEADRALAGELGADGTPTFYINGRELVGAQPLDAFVKVVDEELAKAKELVRTGTPRARVYALILERIASSRP